MNRFSVRHPLAMYFGMVFLVSWGGGLALRAIVHAAGARWGPLDALGLFPFLILSVAATGVVLTGAVDGRQGLRQLRTRVTTWRIGWWYTVVLLPPSLILTALHALGVVVNASFTPNFFPLGFSFGVAAGLFEEVGWTGYAFPKLLVSLSWGRASVLLGVLWAAWHLPVVDFLGAATPHGTWWLAFFVAFALIVSGLRVIIAWVFMRTRSVLIAQLIHISSTGSLVMFSPPRVTPCQESLWYGVYGVLLWIVAGSLLLTTRTTAPAISSARS